MRGCVLLPWKGPLDDKQSPQPHRSRHPAGTQGQRRLRPRRRPRRDRKCLRSAHRERRRRRLRSGLGQAPVLDPAPGRRCRRAGQQRGSDRHQLEPRREHDRRVCAGAGSRDREDPRRHETEWAGLRSRATAGLGRQCRRSGDRGFAHALDGAPRRPRGRGDRGAGAYALGRLRSGRRALLRQHRRPRADRHGRCKEAQRHCRHVCHSLGRPARARLRPQHASPVLCLRRGPTSSRSMPSSARS